MRSTGRRILSKLSPAGICESSAKRAHSAPVRLRSRFSGAAGAGASDREPRPCRAARVQRARRAPRAAARLSALAGSVYPGAISAVKSATANGVPPVLTRFFSALAASSARLIAFSGAAPVTVRAFSPSDTVQTRSLFPSAKTPSKRRRAASPFHRARQAT